MSEEREQRNAVFAQHAAAAGVNPQQPMITSAERVKADFGFEIPVETIPLPSGGKVYAQGSPLHNRETVDIKAMTAKEEDVLTNKVYLKKGTVINELIRSCLIDKSIDPSDLIGGDRNTLMVAIRITGYTQDYDAEVECSSCNEKFKHTFDLSKLEVKRLAIEPVHPGENKFLFTLPTTKLPVVFRFLSGRDEDEISTTNERLKKQGIASEQGVTTNLIHSIVSVAGKEDRAAIANFVRNMLARDSKALREYIRKNEPGILMRQEVVCPACNHGEEVAMPFTTNFLWPNVQQ